MQHLQYFKVPKILFKDDSLDLKEFKMLVKLFSKVKQTELLTADRWLIYEQDIKLEKKLKESLVDKSWLVEENERFYLTIPPEFLPEDNKDFNQAGSKIARKWNEYFGTLNLTPTNLQKLLSFVEDGISEEVIIEVMKISSKKTKSNPINYIVSILRDYLNRSIYTIYDFKEEKQRMEEYEKRLQEINRKKEKRDEEETLEDYYRKGYR